MVLITYNTLAFRTSWRIMYSIY